MVYNAPLTGFRYFDACAEVNQNDKTPLDLGDGLKPIDFKVNHFSATIGTIDFILSTF